MLLHLSFRTVTREKLLSYSQGVALGLEILRPKTTEVDPFLVSKHGLGMGCDGGDERVGRSPEPLPGFNQKSYTLICFIK